MQADVSVHMTFTYKNFLTWTVAKVLCVIVLIAFGLAAAKYADAGQAASDPDAVRVGGDVKQPIKIRDAKPVYPPMARQSHTQGVVVLEVTIGDDGKVKAVKVLKSIAMLELAAVDAVKQWEFKPTIVNGKATPVIMTTAVNFKLD
jgi:TonB family protein